MRIKHHLNCILSIAFIVFARNADGVSNIQAMPEPKTSAQVFEQCKTVSILSQSRLSTDKFDSKTSSYFGKLYSLSQFKDEDCSKRLKRIVEQLYQRKDTQGLEAWINSAKQQESRILSYIEYQYAAPEYASVISQVSNNRLYSQKIDTLIDLAFLIYKKADAKLVKELTELILKSFKTINEELLSRLLIYNSLLGNLDSAAHCLERYPDAKNFRHLADSLFLFYRNPSREHGAKLIERLKKSDSKLAPEYLKEIETFQYLNLSSEPPSWLKDVKNKQNLSEFEAGIILNILEKELLDRGFDAENTSLFKKVLAASSQSTKADSLNLFLMTNKSKIDDFEAAEKSCTYLRCKVEIDMAFKRFVNKQALAEKIFDKYQSLFGQNIRTRLFKKFLFSPDKADKNI